MRSDAIIPSAEGSLSAGGTSTEARTPVPTQEEEEALMQSNPYASFINTGTKRGQRKTSTNPLNDHDGGVLNVPGGII